MLSVVTLTDCSGAVLASGGVAPCSCTSPWQTSWSLSSPSQVSLQPPHLDPDSQTQLTAFTMELQTNLREYCSCTYNHKEDQTYRKIGNYLDNLWWLLGAFASLANDKTTFGLDNQWESMGLALVLTRRRPQFGPSPWSCNFEFVKIRLKLYVTSSQTLTSDEHLLYSTDPHYNLVSGQMVWEIMDRRWTAGWGFCKVSSSILIIQNISNYLVCRMCSVPGYPLQTIYHKLTDWPFITI